MLLAGCTTPPLPAGAVAFGLMGDTPYSEAEAERLDHVIGDINRQKLDFVVHVGDIGSSRQACNDDWLAKRKVQFGRIRHPFVLLPGDNEWSDCRRPLERLAAWRGFFCFKERIPGLERQRGPYCEHLRWEAGGYVFVALNVQGSNNNVGHSEHGPRMAAVYAWLEESARRAEKRRGLVVLMQANPFITLPRDGYAELRERLRVLGERMAGKVVLVHGDTHLFHDDEPIPGVRRIEVWGSPFVRWLNAAITDEGLAIRQAP
jgi:hypothetical protein